MDEVEAAVARSGSLCEILGLPTEAVLGGFEDEIRDAVAELTEAQRAKILEIDGYGRKMNGVVRDADHRKEMDEARESWFRAFREFYALEA